MSAGLRRFIVTPETARHRYFLFLEARVLPDNMLTGIALDDAYFLGVLSSSVHVCWALKAGGRLGVGNDPRYTKTRCFDPFPFPAPTDSQKTRIRTLGESLDAHRKRQQKLHPTLTLTGMYNVLEKLRSGAALTDKERVIHEQGLVSVLKQIHDDLDAAVVDAYGWPHDLTDEQILEKLVKLNAERAEEERKGLVRWLRPDFQNPTGARAAMQVAMTASADDEEEEDEVAAPAKAIAWPKKLAEQIAAVRDLVVRGASGRTWTTDEVAAAFKASRRTEVRGILESLAALGHVVRVKVGGVASWQVPVRGATPVS